MKRRRRHAWLLRLLLVVPIDATAMVALESVRAGGARAYGPGLVAVSLCLATLFAAPPDDLRPVEQPPRDDDDAADDDAHDGTLVVHAERWAPGSTFLGLVLGGLFVSSAAVALSWLGLLGAAWASLLAAASALVAVAAGVVEDAAEPFTELRLTRRELSTATRRIRLSDIAAQRVVTRASGAEIDGTDYTRTELVLTTTSGAKLVVPLPMHEATMGRFLAALQERTEAARAARPRSPRLDDAEAPSAASTPPLVRLRGRAVTGAHVYFRIATDREGRRLGEVPASGERDLELEVDGARVRVELSVDTCGPDGGGGALWWGATDAGESPVAFDAAVPEGSADVTVLEMRVSEGADVEVWGRVLAARRGEGAYRARPATRPSEVAAIVVGEPPSPYREGVFTSAPAFAVAALSPLVVVALDARMPWASAHLLLAVVVAAAATFLGFVTGPPTMVPLAYNVFLVDERAGAARFLGWGATTVGLAILPFFSAFDGFDGVENATAARWLTIVAPVLFAAYPLLDLVRSGRGARRLGAVARALSSPDAPEGVVLRSTPVEASPDVDDRTLHLMLAGRDGRALERTWRLSASTWAADLGLPPSKRERALVIGDTLWASRHEPRSALAGAWTTYRRFRVAALVLSALSVFAALRVYGWL